MTRSSDDYQEMLLASLPQGAAWTRDPDTLMVGLVSAFADGFARLEARAYALLDEAFPSTTVQLLPDWERNYGLPDPCSGPASGIADRQRQLVGRWLFRGGQSRTFFIELAANYGFDITLSTFPVATVDGDCSDALNDDSWAWALQVGAPLDTITYADCGLSDCTDPLESWSNQVLECVMSHAAHADVDLIFVYS